jgi:hypothetical protein
MISLDSMIAALCRGPFPMSFALVLIGGNALGSVAPCGKEIRNEAACPRS